MKSKLRVKVAIWKQQKLNRITTADYKNIEVIVKKHLEGKAMQSYSRKGSVYKQLMYVYVGEIILDWGNVYQS